MSLSASSLLRDGSWTQILPGSKGGRRSTRIGRTGCRCEVKSDVKVADERMRISARKENGWPAEAARRAVRDAMLMCSAAQNIDERARNDILLLSRCVFRIVAWELAGLGFEKRYLILY